MSASASVAVTGLPTAVPGALFSATLRVAVAAKTGAALSSSVIRIAAPQLTPEALARHSVPSALARATRRGVLLWRARARKSRSSPSFTPSSTTVTGTCLRAVQRPSLCVKSAVSKNNSTSTLL